MRRLISVSLPAATLVICLGLVFANTSFAETDPDGALFEPSDDALADVQQALSRASDNDKLALVVLGANWCHDSRALAARLYRSPLAETIEQNYELVFVDVGYYEQGRDVVQQFGVVQYYATPTVLIVDPSSGQLLNDEGRHIWGDAARIDMPSSVEYFEEWATHDTAAEPPAESDELKQLYAEIDQFERQLAERVAAGYAVVGPKLAAYKVGDPPKDFRASWDELSRFRNAVPRAIQDLRDEAQRRVSEGEQDIKLQYPEFPSLSWESAD
jgi:thiol-disulfide isomerase/thioredoxin